MPYKIKSRLDIAEKKTSEVKGITVEIEMSKEKNHKNEKSISELCNNCTCMYIYGVSLKGRTEG